MAYNFLENGNGILACYNMFPRQFANIDEMTKYLPTVAEMGFNAVWINPIQKSGGVSQGGSLTRMDKNNGVWENNRVIKSLYAMNDPDVIDDAFSPKGMQEQSFEKSISDTKSLKVFTSEARKLGIVPMFDLVLNHVASDSKLCIDHPHWFHGEDPQFRDAKKFNYDDDTIRKEIIEQLWKPYISKYMVEYGFDGVRVDAVGHLHPKLRQEIYDYIYELCKEHNKPSPVILDEALFSDENVQSASEKLLLSSSRPTHITTGAYYAVREAHTAGLPQWTKEEAGSKAQVVFMDKQKNIHAEAKGGTINFSGNHDHNSLMMKVLLEIAHERLANDTRMNPLYERVKTTINHRYQDKIENDESRELKFLYAYVKDIENEIQNGNSETISDVERRMKDKLAIVSLTSSGGWYALCGDEYGDPAAKSVFLREGGGDLYPQREHQAFYQGGEEYKKVVNKVLKEMAIELMKKDTVSLHDQVKLSHSGMYGIYQDLSSDVHCQSQLLLPYIDNIKLQINSGVKNTCDQFSELMQKENIKVEFNENDYKQVPRNSDNHWHAQFDMKRFISKLNGLLTVLPKSEPGFWNELIAIPNMPNLVVVVRKNGLGLQSPTDLVIVNLDDKEKVNLTKSIIHSIACEFQKRTVPQEGWYEGNPDYDAAYNGVMKANIHTDETIFLDKSLRDSFSNVKVSDLNAGVFYHSSQKNPKEKEIDDYKPHTGLSNTS